MNVFTSCFRQDKEYAEFFETLKRDFRGNPLPILVSGLCEGAGDAFLATLSRDALGLLKNQPLLLLCPSEKECVRLCALLNRNDVASTFYIQRDLNFFDVTSSHEYEHSRLEVLTGLLENKWQCVLTTPDALLGYTVPPAVLSESLLILDENEETDLSKIPEKLISAGYVRVERTEAPGQFSLRGDILDIYPPYGVYTDRDGGVIRGETPFRAEFFGDDIDRMGVFDPDTQRVTTAISLARFSPCRELNPDKTALESIKSAILAQIKKGEKDELSGVTELKKELEAIERCQKNGESLKFADKYINLIYPEEACLLDYFPKTTLTTVYHTQETYERLRAYRKHQDLLLQNMVENGEINGKLAEYDAGDTKFERWLNETVTVHVNALAYTPSGKRLSGLFAFHTRHTVSYREKEDLLFQDLHGYIMQGYRAFVLAENEVEARWLTEKIASADFVVRDLPATIEEMEPGTVTVLWKEVIPGFEMMLPRIVFLSTYGESRVGGLTDKATSQRRRHHKSMGEKILSYGELQVGDYVVHEAYGIGQYTGMETKTCAGVTRDYIGVRYDGGNLFLPVEKLDRIAKYIGARGEDGAVKLSKMGSETWKHATSRAKAAARDMAKELIQLYAQRERLPGFACQPDDKDQKAFEDAFEYEETDGQLQATADIKKDMEKPHPMDRLLCGDVGYGKTEVALRAVFKAIENGKQVALLVPTTLLCMQHYQTALSRMRAFGVNVEMISRFRSPKQQAEIVRRVARGDVDLLIGTHALLSKRIEFRDLGLVIIDEEQRFGVAQKEKLKMRTTGVDVLSLSATPIPRTVNMAMSGIRDISVLEEAPRDRLPVQTYVLSEDDFIIMEGIRRELRRGGQVYYLCNNIEKLSVYAHKIATAIPEARIATANGQMEKDDLEGIWEDMLRGEVDVLVCTSIIETGVDVPNANTLIVADAHRLGLSQLHQIRGRIGRSSRRAYAYFTYPRDVALSELSAKRLQAIREYGEFGSGFRIAMRDMELRGAGDLLGSRQHGHLDAIGYDLYIRLLNEAVLEEKGEKVQEKTDCTLSLNQSAFLPDQYVPYPRQRMELYRKISLIENEEDYRDVLDEMSDRFGAPPKEALRLLDVGLLHNLASHRGITAIREEGNRYVLSLKDVDLDFWQTQEKKHKGQIRISFSGDAKIYLTRRADEEGMTLLAEILKPEKA